MDVFKLRIETDENPGFVLDVEIRADQTFFDLHEFLVKTLKLNDKELASFYVADENWEKYEEITLLDMSGEEDNRAEEHDDFHTIFLMSSTSIDKFISGTNQYLVYEYDFLQLHTFLIECISVKQVDNRVNYPHVAQQKGSLKITNKVMVEKDPEKLRESLLNEFNSMVKGDMDEEDDDNDGIDDY
ncbi:MAG: hypothetical protein IH598_08990 [Bacteroidales bacterium]|nr:hypothetical protein [Bacteroidales bacterium]